MILLLSPLRLSDVPNQITTAFFRWAAGRDYMNHDHDRHDVTTSSSGSDSNDGSNNNEARTKPDASKDSTAARPEKLPRIHIRHKKRRIVIRESSSSDSSNNGNDSSNNIQTPKANNRSANCNP
jgi:hypothetical protein